jgi:transposase
LGAKEIRAMPAAVKLREDFSAEQLRALARRSKDANQSRRLLSLAAICDGKDRGEAAWIGGMDRQTLRDWVHRFNAAGPEGLFDHWTDGPKPRLSAERLSGDENVSFDERQMDVQRFRVSRKRGFENSRVDRRQTHLSYQPTSPESVNTLPQFTICGQACCRYTLLRSSHPGGATMDVRRCVVSG